MSKVNESHFECQSEFQVPQKVNEHNILATAKEYDKPRLWGEVYGKDLPKKKICATEQVHYQTIYLIFWYSGIRIYCNQWTTMNSYSWYKTTIIEKKKTVSSGLVSG